MEFEEYTSDNAELHPNFVRQAELYQVVVKIFR